MYTKINIKNLTKNILEDLEFFPRTRANSFLRNIWMASIISIIFLLINQKDEGIRKINLKEIQFALKKGLRLTGSKIENKLFIVNFYSC